MKHALWSRLAALILVSVLALSLVACGGEEEPESDAIYSLDYKGTKIALGASAEGVLEALGAEKSKNEIGDCGGLGAQVQYIYDDITLYVLESKDGKHTVDSFSLNHDMVSTDKDVCIGDDKQKVLDAYGEPTAQNEKILQYQNGSYYLLFGFDEAGTVSSIEWKVKS